MEVINNIKELREHLDKLEGEFNCEEYFGRFELQKIYIPYFDVSGTFLGYGPPVVLPDISGNCLLETPQEFQGVKK